MKKKVSTFLTFYKEQLQEDTFIIILNTYEEAKGTIRQLYYYVSGAINWGC